MYILRSQVNCSERISLLGIWMEIIKPNGTKAGIKRWKALLEAYLAGEKILNSEGRISVKGKGFISQIRRLGSSAPLHLPYEINA
jgi:hypothetical protein